MITVPYTKVLQLAVEMSSRTYPPTVEQSTIFKTFITHHLRSTWEAYSWPELCQPSVEYFAPQWLFNGGYKFGDVVFYRTTGKYYQMIRVGPTISLIEPTDPAYWAEVSATPTAGLMEYMPEVAYDVGNQVLFEGNAYQLCGAAPANTPPTETDSWGLILPFFRFISKTLQSNGQPRLDVIGEFFGVTLEDP